MYQQIFFDFDSTLVAEETLDALADLAGVGSAVRRLTEASMNGELPMEQVFERKMDMIAPSLEMIAQLHARRPSFVSGIEEVIAQLHGLDKEVYVLTSNFTQIVAPFAQQLGIDPERVISNEMYHDENGFYIGMNAGHPLAHSGGKRIVIDQYVRDKHSAVMIGDSVTDLACQPSVRTFIGFGGVTAREVVRASADVFVDSPDSRELLMHLLSDEERSGL